MNIKDKMLKSKAFNDMKRTFYSVVIISSLLVFVTTIAGGAFLLLNKIDIKRTIGIIIVLIILLLIESFVIKFWIRGPFYYVISYIDYHYDINVDDLISDKMKSERYGKRLYIGNRYLFFNEDFGQINLVSKKDIKRLDVIGATATKNNKPHLVIIDNQEQEYQVYFFSRKKAEKVMHRLSSELSNRKQ